MQRGSPPGLFVAIAGEGEEGVFEFGTLHVKGMQGRVEGEQFSECGFGLGGDYGGDFAADGGAGDAGNVLKRGR